jgi:hypothetical protein
VTSQRLGALPGEMMVNYFSLFPEKAMTAVSTMRGMGPYTVQQTEAKPGKK